MPRRFNLIFFFASTALAAEPLPSDHAARMTRGLEVFETSVARLLTEHCLKCHGGEKGTKGDLDLATRETLLKGGESGPSIVLWKSGESLLMKSIRHEDADLKMPKKADKLSDDAIAKIAAWIDLGAPYAKPLIAVKKTPDRSVVTDADRAWWAFQPLTRVEPPAPGNPIDAFLNAKLSAKGIAMNSPAEPRAFIRRLQFDLTGLPPTPEEAEAFARESHSSHQSHQSHETGGRNETHEQVVNSLLASPHYGERWGRHWLDLARYGESHGYEQDYDRPNAWHYRDFVIRALNADMPFDQFVCWQIAGDELSPDEPEAWKATGFLAAGTHATQITANQAEKERYDELDDQIGTIGTAMLGLTIGCARCHDHKFDPIPTNDYYRLLSTFTTTVRSDYDLVVDPKKFTAAKTEWDAEHARLTAARDRFESEQLPARIAAWEQRGERPQPPKWLVLDGAEAKSVGGATLAKQADGSFLASGANVDNDTYTFTVPSPVGGITAVKIEALADKSLVKRGPGRASNGNFALSMLELSAGGQPAKFVRALASFEQSGLPVAAAIDADAMSSWAVDPQFGKDHAAVFVLEAPLAAPVGSPLVFTLTFSNNKQHSIGRPRLSVTTDATPTLDGNTGSSAIAEALRVLEKPAAQRSAEDVKTLLTWSRMRDDEWRKLDGAVAEHARKEPQPEKVKALICSEGVPPLRLHTQGPDFYEKTFLLKRGDLNQKLGEAPQGFLTVLSRAPEQRWLSTPPAGSRTPLRRTALAKWLTDTDAGAGNLLARVIVNRLWQHHFGRGLVSTPSDFGAQGEKPSHPELLDWLAGELIRGGWRLKPIHRLIMTSAAYAQSTAWDAQRAALDPDNTLLWRRAKLRLEGETIRDAILSVTGALDAKMFGPGTLDPAMKRRSIYFQIKRSQLPPMMVTFDAPDTLTGMGLRPQTTVAPQALLLMNNKLIRAAALDWAKKLTPLAPDAAVTRAYLAALARPPTDGELATAADFLRTQTMSYESTAKPEAAHLALADFCQAVLSMNEFVYVE
jgi:mono/diheme cytochrome c family protein